MGETDIIFCHFEPFFAVLPHYGPHEKKKTIKKTGDIILFHVCTMNEDHRMYGSRDIRHDRQSFLSFWAFFAL